MSIKDWFLPWKGWKRAWKEAPFLYIIIILFSSWVCSISWTCFGVPIVLLWELGWIWQGDMDEGLDR